MPHLATYVGLADHSERTLADSFRTVAEGYAQVADVFHTCRQLAGWCDDHRARIAPAVERYGEEDVGEPERLRHAGLAQAREGEVGLLRDLQDLHLLATLTHARRRAARDRAALRRGDRARDLLAGDPVQGRRAAGADRRALSSGQAGNRSHTRWRAIWSCTCVSTSVAASPPTTPSAPAMPAASSTLVPAPQAPITLQCR